MRQFKFLTNNTHPFYESADHIVELPRPRRMSGRTIAQNLIEVRQMGSPRSEPLPGESTYDYYGRQEDDGTPDSNIWCEGYRSARRGYPINNYPLYLNERQREIFYQGWNNFVDRH